MKENKIPFNKVTMLGSELPNITESVSSGSISGNGIFTKQCQSFLETTLDCENVFLTTSCTHALEMTALLLNLSPGDEVILPSYTFVSTANAFILRGVTPVFIDIREDTLNLDEAKLEECITNKTKAIVPVHYAGVGCEMDKIMEIANHNDISVVEDNAHGLFGKYRGRFLGTFGQFGTQSFHETKNFTCGEGGALIINDASYAKRAEIIWEKGTNRSSFFRGEVDKYSWVDSGSSYLPSDILAAFLMAQLMAKDDIQERRKVLWNTYNSELKDWADTSDVRLPFIPEYCEQAYHMFYILLPSDEVRTRFIEYMASSGIQCSFHYVPLHLSKMGKKFTSSKIKYPWTETLSSQIVRLPFYYSLTDDEQLRVIEAIRLFKV